MPQTTEFRCPAEYLGMDIITNGNFPYRDFVYFIIHNSLLDSSMGTPILDVKAMVDRAISTGTITMIARNNIGRTLFAVPAININPITFQEILLLAKGLKQLAISQGKTLSDLFDVKGFEMHDVYLECSVDTVINGIWIYNKDYTKKMINIGEHSLSDILELDDTSLVTFGHVSRAKLSSSDWIPYTEEELNVMLKADLLELAQRMNLYVNSSTTKPNIIKAILEL